MGFPLCTAAPLASKPVLQILVVTRVLYNWQGLTLPCHVRASNRLCMHVYICGCAGSWLSMCCLADQLAMVLMTPLRYGDIPLSAVDFHISSIIEELLQKPQVLSAAETLAVSQAQDAAGLLKRAMWLFRSGLNNKKLVSVSCCPQQSSDKSTLQPLWVASQGCADAWSADYIRRRFG